MSFLKKFLTVLASAVIIAAPAAALANRQDIIDWWRLRDYVPAARIVELADHTAMTDYGRKLFYVHHPQLSGRSSFTGKCSADEHTIVLGCYITGRAIYIFDVEDPRLDGIEEVTAAHEMLHAAYDRLSVEERRNIDEMTAAAFGNLEDQRIKRVVGAYQNRDAAIVPNELHSILATEVRQLPAELETYYQRYFTDRGRVVAYSEAYEAVFSAQQRQIESLKNQIADLEKELAADRQAIDSQESALIMESERLNSLRRQGQIEEYNSAIPGYNAEVDRYKDTIAAYNLKVRQLNALIEQYNHLAIEQKELTEAIDSRL